jgi:hypothetical protein
MRMTRPIVCALALLLAVPVGARWKEVAPARIAVAGSTLSVTADPGWNRWTKRPIKQEEVWSLDGPLLNRLDFFAGIAPGEPLARERNKKREPLPKFKAAMRAPSVMRSVRSISSAISGAPDFVVETVAPVAFAGDQGFRLRFRYTKGELVRRGEARGRVVDGKLYLITYAAPALYYFDTGLARATAIMDSALIG